jgi:hypothetical protein
MKAKEDNRKYGVKSERTASKKRGATRLKKKDVKMGEIEGED